MVNVFVFLNNDRTNVFVFALHIYPSYLMLQCVISRDEH